jgi:excisionase family DNA binding protein
MPQESPGSYVGTAQVAQALGVSVSTVKRWVDEGVLPAHKTAGGHRKLLLADVLELARRSDLPQADLTQLLAPGRRNRKVPTKDLADPLYQALMAGETLTVRNLLLGSYRQGKAVESLADEVVAPAMTRVGRDWELGRIDVLEEHRATQLCTATLFELKRLLEDRADHHRPRAVGGAVEGDYSQLPTLLAQMTLLDAGWDALNLGPHTPFASLCKALREYQPRLVWLSVSHLGVEAEFLRGYREFYRLAEQTGVAVAIGGHALTETVRAKIPYTTFGDGLTHLAAFARTLHPRPRPPRRGRPPKA